MQVLSHKRSSIPPQYLERTWPLDARMAMFVLEAGGQDPQPVRDRSAPREPFRMIATLTDRDQRKPSHATVYVRDRTPQHLGFICQNELPVGSTVWLDCASEDGHAFRTPCEVARLRPFMSGWHEGVLHVRD